MDITNLLRFTSPDDYTFCYKVMCEAAFEIERLRQENSSLKWKNPHPNVSEADFAKWQQEREQYKARIKELEQQLSETKEELAYWCRVSVQRT